MSKNVTLGYEEVDFILDPEDNVDLFYNPDPVLISLYVSIILISLLSNSVLIVIAVKYNYNKTGNNIIFLVNLAVADLLVTVVCMPVQVSKAVTLVWFYGNFFCKMVTYLQGVSVAASVFTIAAMSVDRYLAIVPEQRLRPWGWKGASLLLGALWLGAMLTFSPLLFVATAYTVPVPVYTRMRNISIIIDKEMDFCIEDWNIISYRRNFGIFSFSMVYALPGIITIMSYAFMGRRLCSVRPPHSGSTRKEDHGHQALRLMKERRRLAYVLLLIAILFAVCWLPYNIILLLIDTNMVGASVVSTFLPYTLLLGHANSAVNPVVYCLMTKNFRIAIRKLFCCQRYDGGPCTCRTRGQRSSSDENYHGPHKKCFLAMQPLHTWNREVQQNRIDTRIQTAPTDATPSSRRRMHAQAMESVHQRRGHNSRTRESPIHTVMLNDANTKLS